MESNQLGNVTNLLRATKGAGLSILVCMVAMRNSKQVWIGPELSAVTGYSKSTIDTARAALLALGYVIQPTRYGIALPPAGGPAQLSFLNLLDFDTDDGLNLAVPSSSGSYNKPIDHDLDRMVQQLPQPATAEKQPPTIPDGCQPLIDMLIDHGCYNHNLARIAVVGAFEDGATLDEIFVEIMTWHIYARSPKGSTIKTPGLFAATRIKAGDKPIHFKVFYDHNAIPWQNWKSDHDAELREIAKKGGENWFDYSW